MNSRIGSPTVLLRCPAYAGMFHVKHNCKEFYKDRLRAGPAGWGVEGEWKTPAASREATGAKSVFSSQPSAISFQLFSD